MFIRIKISFKKNITFENSDGKRIRDSNLSKTFNLKISKEELQYEFARNGGHITGARSASQTAAAGKTDQAAGGGESLAEKPNSNNLKRGR